MASKNNKSEEQVGNRQGVVDEEGTRQEEVAEEEENGLLLRKHMFEKHVLQLTRKIYDYGLDFTNAIASKIHEYADKMSGRDPKNPDTEYASVVKIHLDYIDKLRRDNPANYRKLVEFAQQYVATPAFDRPELLKAFFAPLT